MAVTSKMVERLRLVLDLLQNCIVLEEELPFWGSAKSWTEEVTSKLDTESACCCEGCR